MLPPVVIGYALLVLLGRKGVMGAWLHDSLGITFAFNWKGAAVASAVIAFPLMVRAIRLSLENVDRGIEAAAATLGASRVRVFFTITLPLTLPGVLTGVILGFARSLSEFGATITFVSNIPGQTRTLPLALYSLTQSPGGEPAAFRLCLISVAVAFVTLLASEVLARRIEQRLQGLTMLEIVLRKRLGQFEVEAAIRADGPTVTALFGRSGAGKTSVVNMVAGLVRPDEGRIVVDGRVLFDHALPGRPAAQPPAHRLYFPGRPAVPPLYGRGNLAYGMDLVPPAERFIRFEQVVDVLGIGPLLDRRPGRLSGGEKQRVAIGRALLTSPRLMLMDEPLASLDAARKAELLPFIGLLPSAFGVPDPLCQPRRRRGASPGRRAGADGGRQGGRQRRGRGGDEPAGNFLPCRVAWKRPACSPPWSIATTPSAVPAHLAFAGGTLRVPLVDAAVGAPVARPHRRRRRHARPGQAGRACPSRTFSRPHNGSPPGGRTGRCVPRSGVPIAGPHYHPGLCRSRTGGRHAGSSPWSKVPPSAGPTSPNMSSLPGRRPVRHPRRSHEGRRCLAGPDPRRRPFRLGPPSDVLRRLAGRIPLYI